MSMNSPPTTVASRTFNGNVRRRPQGYLSRPMDGRSRFAGRHDERADRAPEIHDPSVTGAVNSSVEIFPTDIVKRRTVAWGGMTAEIVQATRSERIEYRFQAPVHLLAVHEQGVRREGETFVEGLPRSSLRDLRKKLTFVPAGLEYYDRQEPRTLSRVVHFYFDPSKMPISSEARFGDLAPRLHFEDPALWDTALRLATLIESSGADNLLYVEALGVVLAHELARPNPETPRIKAPIQGGLASWQQRIVTTYIDEHLDEQISLAALAQLVRLSPYHFCRTFKQSLGIPPHRFHTLRRIERAKALLAKPGSSVTDIGLRVGFNQTSSFSAAFRKATGLTPTAYHRSLS
jgi:AraC family transcriptional regulator